MEPNPDAHTAWMRPVFFGVSVSAPSDRMQDDWIDDLLSTAQRISAGLGYSAQPEARAKN